MEKHPIENIMTTTMENIRDMIDVNTVIGEAITTSDGSTVIPVSKVCFGFVAGGGEYGGRKRPDAPELPFAGGTGAGVSVHPLGFIVSSGGQVRMLPAEQDSPVERAIELAPQILLLVRDLLEKKLEKCAGSKNRAGTVSTANTGSTGGAGNADNTGSTAGETQDNR